MRCTKDKDVKSDFVDGRGPGGLRGMQRRWDKLGKLRADKAGKREPREVR